MGSKFLSAVGFVVGAVLLTGCPSRPAVGTLSGRVVNAGRPVDSGRILFENAVLGAGTVVDLDKDGRFEVATGDGPGLPPGIYRAAVKPRGSAPPPTQSGDLPHEALAGSSAAKEPPPKNELIPEKFYGFETSGLTTEIKAGANPAWEIDLGR